MDPIDNHFNQGLVKLVPPFWGKPRMASLLLAMLNRVQELEDATWDVLDRYTLEGADDARLAVLGRIVGQHNAGWDTETYRAVLRGKIRANKSRGLTDDIIAVVQQVTPTAAEVYIETFVPATMVVWTDASIDASVKTALTFLLPKTRSAGVALFFAWVNSLDGLIVGDTLDASAGGLVGDSTDADVGSDIYSVAAL